MPLHPAAESGDRSHGAAAIESVAQLSTALEDTDPGLDPALARMARQAAAEGVVLLRNDDGVLPLGSRPVAVFGRTQLDWFAVGYGSGGDVKVPYIWNLVAGLRDAGVAVDAEVADLYSAWCAAHPPELTGTWGQWPHHLAEMPLDPVVVTAAATRADTAVVVIGRAAGEARESVLEAGSYYLDVAERALLDAVTASFSRTVVVLDAGNVMDVSWLADYGDRITGLVAAWQGGMEGARAVAAVLSGETPATGKLTDAIALSYPDYPSSANFGDPEANTYAEDIFVGYRYFETFAPERVLFPFGFGLGYTTFALTTRARFIADGAELSIEVRNTGNRAGAETVQVYVAAPDGSLSQPARRLVAYRKTAILLPGRSERVDLRVAMDELASYDDTGVTGHRSAWVLEPGDYRFFVGTDVRTAVAESIVTIPDLRVVRQVTEAAAPVLPFDRMTLARDADGTARVAFAPAPVSTADLRDRILRQLPPALPEPAEPAASLTFDAVVAGEATLDEFVAQLTPVELADIARGDITMHSPLGAAGNAGVLGGVSAALRARGVRPVTATDGPSGIRLSSYASLLPSGTALASTWNPPLVRELAALHAQEMIRKGSDVLLSPGMNIHRDPLCGRNFEYFSEDPLVTGRTAAAIVQGIQSRGVAACPKHFAANNQETNRTRNDSRVSERALREIYLRGFEICVREAAPLAIMTSYNQINGVWAHYHHDLVTTILRGEWGYTGCVMTDWWMENAVDPLFPALENSAYRVRAQVDVLMPGGAKTDAGPQSYVDDSIAQSLARPDGLTIGELQRGARNVLGLVLALVPVVDARA